MAVILFHFDVWPVSGGFVGVDVFFVVSGYLITSIVAADLDAGRFRVAVFYERRLRRIAPALLVVVLVSTLVSLFVFLPGDLRPVGTSLLHAALYTSNMLFYSVANDYFAAEDLGLTPALHTWSLSVEAQFYLVYPWLLLGLKRWPRGLRPVLAGLALLSFTGAAWGAVHATTAAFYLLPWRAWELLAGGLLALWPLRRPLPRVVAESAGLAGLALIGTAILTYSRQTPFPGTAALLPCLGAALLIRAGTAPSTMLRMVPHPHDVDEETRSSAPTQSPFGTTGSVTRALSWRPAVWLGRISYSLYLWHWPVLVFARYGRSSPFGPGDQTLLIGLSLVLAAVSWRWIERPFIARRWFERRRALFAGAFVGTAVAALAAGAVELAGQYGFAPNTLPADVVTLANGQYDSLAGDCRPGDLPQATAPPCRFGAPDHAPSVVLWGNSYARVWTPTLDLDARAQGAAGVSLLLSKCLPLLGVAFPDLPGCAAFNTAAIDYIGLHPELRTVVLAANWFVAGSRLDRLADTLDALSKLGRKVVMVLAPPQPGFAVPRALALAALRHEVPPPAMDLTQARARQRESLDVIEALRQTYGFTVVDPADRLCDGTVCRLENDGRPVFFDAGHVSVWGARRAAGLFGPIFMP